MRDAKEQAERANQSKTRFLAHLSHEIRTPLNAIVGFTQILLNHRNTIPMEYVGYIEHIQTGGRTLSELINNILDLSKIEAGKMAAQMEDLNLKLLIQSVYHINKAPALQKGVKLTYSFDPNLPDAIQSDRTLLNQILINLVGNAIKFTSGERGVSLEAHRDGEHHMRFECIDEGIGIPKEKQQRIFEAFEQAHETNRRTYGGTGLGLALVKKAVELLDGNIELESAPGEGSRFTVRMPLVAADSRHLLTASEQMAQVAFSGDAEDILMVDDDPMGRAMMRSLLLDIGLDMIEAEHGEEGLDLLRGGLSPKLIFMDMEMPVMNGVDTIQAIRTHEIWHELPIIAFAANAFVDQRERGLHRWRLSRVYLKH